MKKINKAKRREASGASGDHGSGPAAGCGESAANGEGAVGGEPAAAGRRSGRARRGPLIAETVSGKTTAAALTAAWEAPSLNEVIS